MIWGWYVAYAARLRASQSMKLAKNSRAEHVFYGVAALALLAMIVIGFARTYFLAGGFLARLPSVLVHVHAILFVGWVILFIVQIALIVAGRVLWHRRLGFFIAGWAVLMVLISPLVLVMAFRRPDSGVGDQELFGNLGQLLVFAMLVARGVILRRDASTHKRLMLLATAELMLPALARLPSLPLPAFLALYLLVPLALVVWDLATLRLVHRATRLGLVCIVLLIAGTVFVPSLDPWKQVAAAVKGT